MKVKDLNFGRFNQYRSSYYVNGFWYDIFVDKKSSRSFYLFIKKVGDEFPTVNSRIPANYELDTSINFSLFYYGN